MCTLGRSCLSNRRLDGIMRLHTEGGGDTPRAAVVDNSPPHSVLDVTEKLAFKKPKRKCRFPGVRTQKR